MIHDKTLLFSADTTVKTATLTEPLSAFERVAIVTTPNTIRETSVTGNCNRRIDTIGSYTTDGYMIWPTNVVIGNNTTTLDVNHFQLLMQQGTSTATRTFGFNNTANNCKRILEVWGIDRKDGVTREGAGSPGSAYTAYNETLLCSGNATAMTGDIQLAERANAFQRLKVGVGTHGENLSIYDVDAPTTYTSWMPLYSYWGTNTGSYYFSEHRYKFSNSATVLTPISGKTHQLGTAAANPYSTTGNYTSTETHIRHPLFAVWGINKKPTRTLTLLPTDGGTLSASETSGYEYDQITLSNTPDERCRFSGYSVTGATINDNVITLQDQNASAHAGFEHAKDLTLINSEHGTLSADAMSGFSGDIVTVDATTDEGWYFTGLNLTGATATGNQFMFVGENVTAEGLYTDQGFPITYENDGHGTLTGDQIYIPGSTGITLQTTYDTYYRLSGYEVTGGTIENNVLVATGPCTARAVYKVNAFTATGNFDKGSDVVCQHAGNGTTNTNVSEKYAIHVSHTGDVPASWYSTSNRWNPSNASSYKISLTAKMTFTASGNYRAKAPSYCTATTVVGSTNNQNQSYSYNSNSQPANPTFTYSKTVTSTTQTTYGVSAKLQANGYRANSINYASIMTYKSTGTNGTWSATGYAP